MIARLFAPVERFLAVEAASGIVLLVTAALAMTLANVGLHDEMEAVLRHELGPPFFRKSVHFLVNDGLMTIFFLVVGLEIRREIHAGELSELRRASLPLAAALGGMVAPALVYLAWNRGPTAHGWGVPTATDIAFAVGVLTLLGRRVPPAVRVLLLALAVVDDVGAILVIALFYSGKLSLLGFGVAAAGIVMTLAMQRLSVKHPLAYVVPGLVVWAGALAAGVHPTLAGVVMGLLCPAAGEPDTSPAVKVAHALHPWVAFRIMPLFAFANAGVALHGADLGPTGIPVAVGVAMGLVVGKPLGIVTASLLAVRLGLSKLPTGVDLRQLVLVGLVAGVGFTMALFVAELGFSDARLLATAKLAVVSGSVVAGVLGLLYGRAVLPDAPVPGAAESEAEAEASTDT